ncbi:HPF/RaiA family ribosome-associated protein [Candidatus Peregrinibacteria bacterium]|nr:HPF/RaiA family ribosome-associated protein [Candidatus Peregrinibacteria bacterium]
MNIQHFEKGLTYTDRERTILMRKISKLATLCKRIKSEDSWIRIEAEHRDTVKKKDSIKMLMTISLPHTFLCAESRQNTVIEAVDRCIEKLEPQLEKYKEKHKGLR